MQYIQYVIEFYADEMSWNVLYLAEMVIGKR